MAGKLNPFSRTMDFKEPLFCCRTCQNKYKTNGQLVRHIRTHHKRKFVRRTIGKKCRFSNHVLHDRSNNQERLGIIHMKELYSDLIDVNVCSSLGMDVISIDLGSKCYCIVFLFKGTVDLWSYINA